MRCSFDVSDKLGLEGSGAAFENVTFAVALRVPRLRNKSND